MSCWCMRFTWEKWQESQELLDRIHNLNMFEANHWEQQQPGHVALIGLLSQVGVYLCMFGVWTDARVCVEFALYLT